MASGNARRQTSGGGMPQPMRQGGLAAHVRDENMDWPGALMAVNSTNPVSTPNIPMQPKSPMGNLGNDVINAPPTPMQPQKGVGMEYPIDRNPIDTEQNDPRRQPWYSMMLNRQNQNY